MNTQMPKFSSFHSLKKWFSVASHENEGVYIDIYIYIKKKKK